MEKRFGSSKPIGDSNVSLKNSILICLCLVHSKESPNELKVCQRAEQTRWINGQDSKRRCHNQ
jgi:hypothetical protein